MADEEDNKHKYLDTEYKYYCEKLEKANDFRFIAGFDVPLNDLYEMLDTCVHNAINKFCPVNFRIVDKNLIAQYDS